MENAKVIITGGTSGIGKAAAQALAKKGADIIITGRNREKGEKEAAAIRSQSGNNRVAFHTCDLASFRSVRDFVKTVKNEWDRLDILVNNAGIVMKQRRLTEDGAEVTFQVNYLSHFLLTHLLLDMLKSSEKARIINVSSRVEKYGGINFMDLTMKRKYNPVKAYGASKLAQLMFTYELSRRLNSRKITVNAMHPGGVSTNLYSYSPVVNFLTKLARPFMLSPEKGAETLIYLAESRDVEEISGKYFIKKKQARSSNESYDLKKQKRLWTSSFKLTGLGKTYQKL